MDQIPDEHHVVALTDLANRCGAMDLEVGCADEQGRRWYATARFRNVRLTAANKPSLGAAARALAEALLLDAQCRCGETVTLCDDKPGCRWRLTGQQWEPGCTAEPVPMPGRLRGNLDEMSRLFSRRPPQ